MEDIEYGYNVLMELDPEAEKEYRDLIKNCVDKYVAQTRRAQKALGKATPAAPKPTASKNTGNEGTEGLPKDVHKLGTCIQTAGTCRNTRRITSHGV